VNSRATVPVLFRNWNVDTADLLVPKNSRSVKGGSGGSMEEGRKVEENTWPISSAMCLLPHQRYLWRQLGHYIGVITRENTN